MLEHSGSMWSGLGARVPSIPLVRARVGPRNGNTAACGGAAGRRAAAEDQRPRDTGSPDCQDDRPAPRESAARPSVTLFGDASPRRLSATSLRDAAPRRLSETLPATNESVLSEVSIQFPLTHLPDVLLPLPAFRFHEALVAVRAQGAPAHLVLR